MANVQRLVAPREVVAFLQNPWFKPGTSERTIQLYTDDISYRRRVLSMSMTGSRLVRAFGSNWFGEMWWDNANPRPVFEASGVQLPDVDHIFRVLGSRKPEVVLTFGLHAREGVERVILDTMGSVAGREWIAMRVMHCHHPNARFKNQVDLDHFALAVKRKGVDA